MASAALRKELECSICLSLYTDPVTLRCGHNFCRGCIDQVLNTQDGPGVYSCPECREEFQERPTLQKNITLCNVMENFLSAHREETKILEKKVLEYYCTEDPDDLCDPEEARGDEGLISYISRRFSAILRGVTFYVEDPADIILDINTAANTIIISDDLKTAIWAGQIQNRPDTAERFHDYAQVMSSGRFSSGRHYWDVEIRGSHLWRVGLCYPSTDRRGRQSWIGDNNKSWVLNGGWWAQYRCGVIHNRKKIQLPHKITSAVVRICLDYEAGQLSFYELCDPIRHLYTFTATFTEPLHAVIYVFVGSVKIIGGKKQL
ncbi:ret finger protein-like 4A [Dendropsophus ebraccatus]|uniref:ret finger protein-like 4A n=1 Tax=Dendropsophus ebraccatus TaxID=150705 RepID=UPI003831665E